MAALPPVRRIRAGVYETADGTRRILLVEHDGPRGGRRPRWEIAVPDPWSGWTIDAPWPHATLRQAREALAKAAS